MQQHTILVQSLPTTYYTSTVFDPEKWVLLFLHGWGQTALSFTSLFSLCAPHNIQWVALDLPGFWGTERPQKARNVEAYSQFVFSFVQKIQLTSVVGIGHSFGCRILLRLSAYGSPFQNQVLIGPGGVEKKMSPVRKFCIAGAKKVFSLPMLCGIGEAIKRRVWSRDYQHAGAMKDTFVQVVNQDLTPMLSKITTPTLLLRGDTDDQILRWQIDVLQQGISGSKLAVLSGGTHFLHTEQPGWVWERIEKFLRK